MHLARFYAVAQIEYSRNFIFKRHFPIHKIFERSCEIGLWRITASRISEIFGTRLHKRLRGKLSTVIDEIEHGHHVFRVYWKNAFLKQYEKFSRFLRNELCSNNLRDFGLKKGLDHLEAVRERFRTSTDRFASFQAQSLNVHVDFPCCSDLPCPSAKPRCATPASKSTTLVSFACWRSCFTAAIPSAAQPPNRSTKPCSPAFSFPLPPMDSISSAMICASSRAMPC